MRRPGADEKDVEETRAYLRGVRPAARLRLGELLGCAGASRKGPSAQQVAEAVATGEPGRRAVAALSDQTRLLLYACVAVGGSDLDSHALRDAARNVFGLEERRIDSLLGELAETGLLRRDVFSDWEVLPGIDAAVIPTCFASFTDFSPTHAAPLEFGFVLAALASYCVESPPRVRNDGALFVRWVEKAAERLAHPSFHAGSVQSLVAVLERLGVLRSGGAAHSGAFMVSPRGAEEVLSQPPEDLALAAALHAHRETSAAAIALGAIERAASGSPDRRPLDPLVLVHAARDLPLVPVPGSRPVSEGDVVPLRVANGLAFLRRAGLVEVDTSGGAVLFRRRVPTPGAGRWIVQPNFEVLVPEDAPPAQVARLGTIASLVRLDRVATFSLNRASVERGAALLSGSCDALAILAANSSVPVPDNVAATVAGWARAVAPMLSFVGAVVVAQTPEQAAFLEIHEYCRGELAPGVFLFATDRLQSVLGHAAKEGLAARPVVRATSNASGSLVDAEPPFEPRHRVTEEAQKVRTRVAAWASGRTEPRTDPLAALRRELLRKHPFGVSQEEDDDELDAQDFDADTAQESLEPSDEAAAVTAPDRDAGTGAWDTPPVGAMRNRIEAAIAAQRSVEVLYVNGHGAQSERTIRPVEIVPGRRVFVRGFDRGVGCELLLERIAAIRDSR